MDAALQWALRWLSSREMAWMKLWCELSYKIMPPPPLEYEFIMVKIFPCLIKCPLWISEFPGYIYSENAKESAFTWSPCWVLWVCRCPPPPVFNFLKGLSDYYKTVYERCTLGGHLSAIWFNSLQPVLTWSTRKLEGGSEATTTYFVVLKWHIVIHVGKNMQP
jgi:hypothetical protein